MAGITGTLFLLSLFLKNLRQQGTLESSGAALVIAFLLGQFVPALDNGYAIAISILPANNALHGVLSSPVCMYRCCCSIDIKCCSQACRRIASSTAYVRLCCFATVKNAAHTAVPESLQDPCWWSDWWPCSGHHHINSVWHQRIAWRTEGKRSKGLMMCIN